jgi:hypothetical protein
MKNLLKFSFLAIAISLSVVACGPAGKKGNGSDTTSTDSSALLTDTNAIDTMAKDSTVKDKVETTTPEVKH